MVPLRRPLLPALASGLLLLGALGAAAAEELELRPGYAPGDAYALSLRATTETEALSRGGERDSFREKVQLDYRATVVVLEVDEEGRPTRERHGGVELTFERPGETGSLFGEGTRYEVERLPRGKIRLFVDGARAEAKVERIVGDLLGSQFEHTLGPKLFDPGRPVEVGESWSPSPAVARRFLRDQGIRVVQLGDPPTATLREVREADGTRHLAIDTRIPIAWLEPSRLPENGKLSDSEATFEGQIRLPAGPGAPSRAYGSKLELRMQGVVAPPGANAKVPWTLESSTVSNQQTRVVDATEAESSGRLPMGMSGEAPPVASLSSDVREPGPRSPADRAARP